MFKTRWRFPRHKKINQNRGKTTTRVTTTFKHSRRPHLWHVCATSGIFPGQLEKVLEIPQSNVLLVCYLNLSAAPESLMFPHDVGVLPFALVGYVPPNRCLISGTLSHPFSLFLRQVLSRLCFNRSEHNNFGFKLLRLGF